jgi:hypothetical protein
MRKFLTNHHRPYTQNEQTENRACKAKGMKMKYEDLVVGKAYRATAVINDGYSEYIKEGDVVFVDHIGYNGLQLTNKFGSVAHSADTKGNFNLFFGSDDPNVFPWDFLEEVK